MGNEGNVTLRLSATAMNVHPKVEVGEQFLRFTGKLTEEDILEVCGGLRRMEATLAWMLGDFLCEVGRVRSDARAQELLNHFGASERCAYEAWWLCRKWDRVKRVKGGSYTHHREALRETGTMEDGLPWVQKAVSEGWSVAEMRSQIRAAGRPVGRIEKRSFADLYGAVAWARRVKAGELTTSDRVTLKRDLKPLVDFWQGL